MDSSVSDATALFNATDEELLAFLSPPPRSSDSDSDVSVLLLVKAAAARALLPMVALEILRVKAIFDLLLLLLLLLLKIPLPVWLNEPNAEVLHVAKRRDRAVEHTRIFEMLFLLRKYECSSCEGTILILLAMLVLVLL